ncbi:MAG: DNA polymerase III subunit delta' [Nitrospinota bacterium]
MKINFDAVWGQESACSSLSRNLETDRLPSGYLFSGPLGTGKTMTADIFAKSLLCQSADKTPCDGCRSCRMYDAGSHPDFFRIEPDGAFIKIAQMREMMSALSLKSYLGGRKTALIDKAEKMNKEAANSFLKTLEEPPPGCVIILVSPSPSALLPTIVSRCRIVRFVPMRPKELAGLLEKNLNMPPDEAARSAALAEGCPGRVLGGDLKKIRTVDGEAAALAERILDLTPEEVVRFAEAWKKRREEMKLLIERLMEILKAPQLPISGTPSGTMISVMKTLGGLPKDNVLRCFDALLESMPALRFNPNIQLFMESTILNLQSILKRGRPIANGRTTRQ